MPGNITPKISVIIAVYDNIPYLEMVLLSLQRQTFTDFEVIIAEDNNGDEMKRFILAQKERFSFAIYHVSQEKKGFRKNRILNESIRISNAECLQFIDGDSVLHRQYLEGFSKLIEPGTVLFGRRVELDERATQKFLTRKDFQLLRHIPLFFSGSKHKLHGLYMPWVLKFQKAKIGLWGCSFCIMKEDMLKVNGFDEDYKRFGVGEDIDLEWRLMAAGINIRSVKYRCIQYHLYHHRNNREDDIRFNFDLLAEKKKIGKVFCVNGLIKA